MEYRIVGFKFPESVATEAGEIGVAVGDDAIDGVGLADGVGDDVGVAVGVAEGVDSKAGPSAACTIKVRVKVLSIPPVSRQVIVIL